MDTGSDGDDSTVAGPQGNKGDTGSDGDDSTVAGPQGNKGDTGSDGDDSTVAGSVPVHPAVTETTQQLPGPSGK